MLRWRKRIVYQFATNIIPVSNYALRDFEETYHIHNKSHIFFNGLKDTRTNIILSAAKKNTVSCVARFDYSKGQDIIIKAFKRVVNEISDAKLILVGDSKLLSEYQSLIASLQLEKSVILTGNVSHDEVINILNTSKISVLPSRNETFGYVIIESMSVGTPVIASNVGGIPEIIRDGINGFLN